MYFSRLIEGYCPELNEEVELYVEYSVINRLGTKNPTSKKCRYSCDNVEESCNYCHTNDCECPIYNEAPMEIHSF